MYLKYIDTTLFIPISNRNRPMNDVFWVPGKYLRLIQDKEIPRDQRVPINETFSVPG